MAQFTNVADTVFSIANILYDENVSTLALLVW